ncbi:MAG: helix-turn-helix transcriptional regulator [Actinobacteria bacterium]|nr:helix-turn-helix transcriptional regulator [Actinomycetota bacterium]
MPHRTLANAPSLQALTHPTRVALMEAVGEAGALTATQASAIVGESPTACAYHLRTLARLGFLEEAGRGRGRERPWRVAGASRSVRDTSDAPEYAARVLSTAATEHYIKRIRDFEAARMRYPADVLEVAGSGRGVVYATPAEMRDLREQIAALLGRYAYRADPALRPPGSVPFEVIAFVQAFDAGVGQEVSGGQAAEPG